MQRRSTEQDVQRVLDDRFSHLDAQALRTQLVGGMRARQHLEEAMHTARATGGRILQTDSTALLVQFGEGAGRPAPSASSSRCTSPD